jgi:stage IV sporulation protein FB
MFIVRRMRSGVPILVHWTVPAVGLFVLGTGVQHILTAAALIASYLAMLVIHEVGHQFVAERRGCRVVAIKIYPIHGTCMFESPRTAYDEILIAWGGPVAQLVVATPLAIYIKLFGSTGVYALDMPIAVLGVFSPIIAAFNLLPIAPLDGRKAWMIIPWTWRRLRRRRDRVPLTPIEAMEEALKKAGKRRGT